MNKRSSRKLTYVLTPNRQDPESKDGSAHTGHTLGVNALAVDPDPQTHLGQNYSSLLYSGGRDGVVAIWGAPKSEMSDDCLLNLHSETLDSSEALVRNSQNKVLELNKANQVQNNDATTNSYISHSQIHTHWINDIALVNNNQSVITCSSDLSVRLWNPDQNFVYPIGQHRDYVKCIATPSQTSSWIATGGLDQRIILWDLNGKGKKSEIDVGRKGENTKGSVYSLAVGSPEGNIIASGGPESVVRLWDSRTMTPILKFIGHTDNIRSILVNQAGNLILSASSDSTIKLWSVTAGKLLNTFDIHDTSVWNLFSNDPNLDVFYSSDRSGVVFKTDLRLARQQSSNATMTGNETESSISAYLCKESTSVQGVAAANGSVWTATPNSWIHRWNDVELSPYLVNQAIRRNQLDDHIQSATLATPPLTPKVLVSPSIEGLVSSTELKSISTTLIQSLDSPNVTPTSPTLPNNGIIRGIISNDNAEPIQLKASFISITGEPILDYTTSSNDISDKSDQLNPESTPEVTVSPLLEFPIETIEGQSGLIKHRLLDNRRHVLTLNTEGELQLWDLVLCKALKSCGKRDIDIMADELNSLDSMSNWCSVATRAGKLFVTLDSSTCFDAEVYIDEIDQEMDLKKQDSRNVLSNESNDQRINLGRWVLQNLLSNFTEKEVEKDQELRDRLIKEHKKPSLMKRITSSSNVNPNFNTSIPVTFEKSSSRPNDQGTENTDYIDFKEKTSQATHQPLLETHNESVKTKTPTSSANSQEINVNPTPHPQPPPQTAPVPSPAPTPPSSIPSGAPNGNSASGGSLMGKLRMLGRQKSNKTNDSKQHNANTNTPTPTKPEVPAKPAPEVKIDTTVNGILEKIHKGYETSSNLNISGLIIPGATDLPVIHIPDETLIIIGDQDVGAGGMIDIYTGTVASLSEDATKLETILPDWVGNSVLQDKINAKEQNKVSFIIQEWKPSQSHNSSTSTSSEKSYNIVDSDNTNSSLPPLSTTATRLSGYRYLRAVKVLSYITERFDRPTTEMRSGKKPEEWLELLCQDKVIPLKMTLASIRSRIWKSGGDVVLTYRRRY